MLKLKRLNKDETYPTDKCSASRCKAPPIVFHPPGVRAVAMCLCAKHQQALEADEVAKQGQTAIDTPAPSVALVPTPEPPAEPEGGVVFMPADDTQAILVQEAAEAKDALAMIEEFQIAEQADYDFANEALGDAKSAWRRLDAQKKKATSPLNETLKTIRSWFKPAQDFYAQAERLLKSKLAEAHRKAKEEQDRALKEVQEAHRVGDAAAVREALVESQAAEIAQADNVSVIAGWDFEIVDVNLLPREYLIPDEKAIRGVVKSLGDKAAIPGVRVFEKDTVVRRDA